MTSATISEVLPSESNDQTVASTGFVHFGIFETDNNWSGANTFATQSQNVTPNGLVATLQYVWDSIATLLNTENTWTLLQHFTSGIATNTAAISGLLTSNSHTTSTLSVTVSGTCPN